MVHLMKQSAKEKKEMTEESNEIDRAHEELPDAFDRVPGTLPDKIKAYREFATRFIDEVQQCCKILPDSLNRPLAERIKLLLERADSESQLAVKLRKRLEEAGVEHSPVASAPKQ